MSFSYKDRHSKISYKSGYKYKLVKEYSINIPIQPYSAIDISWVKLDTKGNLTIRANYSWDGPSGPTIDTSTFMRGSLVHDALYQLMREGYLKSDLERKVADEILYDICVTDGMNLVRALAVYYSVRMFGSKASKNENPVKVAPEDI